MKTAKNLLAKSYILINKIIVFSLNGNINILILITLGVIFFAPLATALINNTYNELLSGDKWKIALSFTADALGVVTVLFSVIGFAAQRNAYRAKVSNFKLELLNEIQKLLPSFENMRVDLTDKELIDYILDKIGPTFVDEYDKYESIDSSFEYQFYSDLSYFIYKYFDLEKYKLHIIKLLVFQTNFNQRKKFVEELETQDNENGRKDLFRAFDFYLRLTNGETLDLLNEKSDVLKNSDEAISQALIDVIKPDNSTVNNLFEKLEDQTLENRILGHVLDQTYSVVAVTREKGNKITGSAIIVKNEENFNSWWSHVEKEAKKILRSSKNKLSEEETEKYSVQDKLNSSKPDLIKQPFSYALKNDPYIKPVLDSNPWSPLFLIDCENLPIGYRNNPVKYIEEVVKKNAQKQLNDILAGIKKILPGLKGIKKELIFDYELLPFDLTRLIIKTRPDKSPKAFESLYISNFIKSENRKGFVKAHILQIKRVLERISPIGLILKSCDQETISQLTSIEVKILKELSQKKNGEISFEGISNILESEPSEKTIKNIFYTVCKKNKVSLSRKKINGIVDEIFQNTKLIQRKLNQGENHGKL